MSTVDPHGHLFRGPWGGPVFCVGCTCSATALEAGRRCPDAAALAPFTGFQTARTAWPAQSPQTPPSNRSNPRLHEVEEAQ